MSMEIPLGRVRGLGAAGEGAEHWWQERLTSIAAFLLLVWLAVSLLRLPGLDHRTVASWLADPFAAVPMLLFVGVAFWHLKLGLQVVVEDYVHDDGSKLFWILLINFASILGAAFALFAVLKIAFAGSAE
ncbi:succinate dehydrogenase, hydrophobic membrane anchor protein [Sphingosinicella terrae]|uniref:succinate dehydrogenase, hydrophobic membrane anchor protein n=1 Tax=Sphingosinicella terrae TaxID=2172047 RepID=UPI000E0D4444|nr:succinate dehydrogenase, hydrophobic membrane anchor protein [Sphingosinicella terrae]